MRASNWTPSPGKEREILRLERRVRRQRFLAGTLGTLALGSCSLTCFGPRLDGNSASWFALAFPAALASLVGWLASARRPDGLHAERHAALREEFGGVGGWLVDLMIVQGATPTGRDVGMVWIEDGRLLFLGERTSFALSPDATRGRFRNVPPIMGFRHPFELALRERTATGPISLGFEFLPSVSETYGLAHGEDRFQNAIRIWLGEPGAAGSLPPLALGPGAPSRAWLMGQALVSAAAWPAHVLFAALAFVLWGPLVAAFLSFACAMFLLDCAAPKAPRLVWRAWQDRRRLESFETAPREEEGA